LEFPILLHGLIINNNNPNNKALLACSHDADLSLTYPLEYLGDGKPPTDVARDAGHIDRMKRRFAVPIPTSLEGTGSSGAQY
jgi:hypothetical protein